MKHLFYSVLFLCSVYSCNQQRSSDAVILIEPEEQYPAESFFKASHSITLETRDDNLLSGINKIQVCSDKYCILDKKEASIYFFDQKGFLINKIAKKGGGPEEYYDLADFMMVDSLVYVLSRIGKALLVYDESGLFVRKYPLDDFYDYFYVDENRDVLLYSNFSNNKSYNLRIFDPEKGEITSEFLPFKRNQSFSFYPTPFNLTAEGDLLLCQQYDYTMYKYENNSLSIFGRLMFHTKDKIPEDFEQIGFDVVYQDLAAKSVVKRIDYVDSFNQHIYIVYQLAHNTFLSQIETATSKSRTIKLEFNEHYPFIFAKPILLCQGFMVNYLEASNVLLFDDQFESDKNPDGRLAAEDNPVLFFYKLSD